MFMKTVRRSVFYLFLLFNQCTSKISIDISCTFSHSGLECLLRDMNLEYFSVPENLITSGFWKNFSDDPLKKHRVG